jgi:hypoxanthine phosphoribosyltransferase
MTEVMHLSAAELDDAAAALGRKVIASGYRPDAVVGIATAGVFVASAMRATVVPDAALLEVASRRPTTRFKDRPIVRRAVALIPDRLSSGMRRLEHRVLMRRPSAAAPRVVTMAPDAEAVARALPPGARLLVVDDAVDSGSTMAAVAAFLASVAPQAHIRTAVLSASTPDRAPRPDFHLYEGALLSGPWSLDAR